MTVAGVKATFITVDGVYSSTKGDNVQQPKIKPADDASSMQELQVSGELQRATPLRFLSAGLRHLSLATTAVLPAVLQQFFESNGSSRASWEVPFLKDSHPLEP